MNSIAVLIDVLLILVSLAVGGFYATVNADYGHQTGRLSRATFFGASMMALFYFVLSELMKRLLGLYFPIFLFLSFLPFNVCWTSVFWSTKIRFGTDAAREYLIYAEEHHMHLLFLWFQSFVLFLSLLLAVLIKVGCLTIWG